jgi:hypothetical protein
MATSARSATSIGHLADTDYARSSVCKRQMRSFRLLHLFDQIRVTTALSNGLSCSMRHRPPLPVRAARARGNARAPAGQSRRGWRARGHWRGSARREGPQLIGHRMPTGPSALFTGVGRRRADIRELLGDLTQVRAGPTRGAPLVRCRVHLRHPHERVVLALSGVPGWRGLAAAAAHRLLVQDIGSP